MVETSIGRGSNDSVHVWAPGATEVSSISAGLGGSHTSLMDDSILCVGSIWIGRWKNHGLDGSARYLDDMRPSSGRST